MRLSFPNMLARPLLAIAFVLVPSAVSFCLISTGSAGEPRAGQASRSLPLAGHSPPAADSPEAHVGKGYAYIKDERYREAAKEFQAALALNPALPRARYQLAVCYFALGQRREAREEFERLRQETAGDSSVLYYLGRLDLLDGAAESSIRRLQSVVAEPPFPDTAYYLGSAYGEKGDLKSAESWLRKAAEMEPRDFRIYDHLARVYQKAGRRQEAEQEFARSSKLREYYNEATRQAVDCSNELETQPLEKARLACEKLFEPDDPDKLTTLGMLYGQHGKYVEALPPLERAAKLDPDSSEIQHNLGLTYFRLRRYAAACGPLEKAVALRPDFFGSNALLGATLYALGEDEGAFRALERAHRLNPQHRDTADLLFKVAALLGGKSCTEKRYSPCLDYLRKATEVRPGDAEIHRRLAKVYELLGQREQAEIESRQADRLTRP